jgi:ABC-type sugar transport system substrate-binding protein
LDVAYTPKSYRNRFDAANYARQIIESKHYKPSLVLTSFWVGSEKKILTMLNDKKIPIITINSDLSEQQFASLGRPRERFPLWLAHLSPNDTKAGNQLAQAIIKESRDRRCHGKKCDVNIFAITGLSYSAVSKQRANGLNTVTRDDHFARLLGIIYGNWDRSLVASKAQTIIQRHDDIDAFWIASDVMAYGLLEGLDSAQMALPEETIIGGIDWSPDTIKKIKNGEMDISLGGHFMEAGWALILFYDYLNKVDLPSDITPVIKTEMSLLNTYNIDELGPFLVAPKWSREQI